MSPLKFCIKATCHCENWNHSTTGFNKDTRKQWPVLHMSCWTPFQSCSISVLPMTVLYPTHQSLPCACCWGQSQAKLVLKCKAMTQSRPVVFIFKLRKTSAHTDDPEFELLQIWVNVSTQMQSKLSGRNVYSHPRTPNSPPDHSHSCCEELSFLALYTQVIQSH